MMIFYFVSLPKYIPHYSTVHFGASIDWKGNTFAYIWGHAGTGVTGLTRGKRKRDMWHSGGVFYSFNVKTKIPPLSTFLYGRYYNQSNQKDSECVTIPKMLESIGNRVLM
jgi:hypothetical protein